MHTYIIKVTNVAVHKLVLYADLCTCAFYTSVHYFYIYIYKIYIYIYIYIYMQVYLYICSCTYFYMQVYILVYICICTYLHICKCTYIIYAEKLIIICYMEAVEIFTPIFLFLNILKLFLSFNY